MFLFLARLRQLLRAKLPFCGGAHFLAGAPSLPPPLTPEQEKALLARMSAGDAAARDELITHNLRLVVYLAKKYESSGVPSEDMISIGTIGLIKAVNTFRPDRGIKLATYASRCIENEILMHFRAQRKVQGEVSLSDALETGTEGDALYLSDVVGEEDTMLEELQDKENRALLRRLIAEKLTKREADILRRRYGLDGRLPQTQRQVAAHYGISRSYVSRLEKKALGKLEEALRERM